MILSAQTQINWAEFGVIVGAIGLPLGVIGWFVAHKLSVVREKEQKRERCQKAISDFEISIDKWRSSIEGTHVPRNQVWGVTLSGGLDFYAKALGEVRAQSIDDIENSIRAVRPFMDSNGKASLDRAWQSYQAYRIEGQEEKDPATGDEFTNHTECKKGLIACLEQLKKIAQGIKI